MVRTERSGGGDAFIILTQLIEVYFSGGGGGGGDAFIILTQLHLIEVYSSANGSHFNLHIIGIAVNKQNALQSIVEKYK